MGKRKNNSLEFKSNFIINYLRFIKLMLKDLWYTSQGAAQEERVELFS